MDEQDISPVSSDRSTGRVIMGALLVAAGSALLIERLGAMPPSWRDGIWPVLLVGYGVARLLQPRDRGREGLFFVLAGAWWLAGVSGWHSPERTWPLLVVALGVSIMFQSLTQDAAASVGSHRLRGRHRGAAPWLLVAILLGAAVSAGIGRDTWRQSMSGDAEGSLRVYSVVGGSNNRMRATTFTGGEVVSIVGGSTVDLRDVTIAPGDTVTVNVFTLMGGGEIRVPEHWIVDVKTIQVMGGVKDERRRRDRLSPDTAREAGADAAASAAPRLLLRGTIIMGGLSIKS